MKKLTTYLLILGATFSSLAQDQDKKEKIEALKIAYITEHVEFTTQEAQAFWPIYNTFESKEDELRNMSTDRRKEKNPEELTESEAKQLLLDMMKIEKQKSELKTQYTTDLLKILPATKVISLFRAEHSFKRKMFEEFKKRRGSHHKN